MTHLLTPTKRSRILKIYETLNLIKGCLDLPLHRFKAVALRKNMQPLVESITETINECNKYVPKEFFTAKEKLIRSFAVLNERKEPVREIVGGVERYKLQDGKYPEFDIAYTALHAQHKDALELYGKETLKANEFLDGTDEIPIQKVFSIHWFNTTMTQEWIDVLYDFITEEPLP